MLATWAVLRVLDQSSRLHRPIIQPLTPAFTGPDLCGPGSRVLQTVQLLNWDTVTATAPVIWRQDVCAAEVCRSAVEVQECWCERKTSSHLASVNIQWSPWRLSRFVLLLADVMGASDSRQCEVVFVNYSRNYTLRNARWLRTQTQLITQSHFIFSAGQFKVLHRSLTCR